MPAVHKSFSFEARRGPHGLRLGVGLWGADGQLQPAGYFDLLPNSPVALQLPLDFTPPFESTLEGPHEPSRPLTQFRHFWAPTQRILLKFGRVTS